MSIRACARLLTALAALAATTLVTSSASAGPHPPEPGVVRVDSGWLRGSVADDHVTFSAIPYAAPPVAERRWRPPARPRPWSGVRDATTPGTVCPQRSMAGIVGAEDCLHLDVTVPRQVRPGQRLPVLVWLHGGGFVSGAAQEYGGARLATSGRLMVVTVNYRLGALGFLSTPALDAGGGNYGLMDQIAALRWVRANAARFGGDPGNVTLAGQSAGARAVCAQLASPFSRGLFHRAIVQSGACDNRVPTRATAQAVGDRAGAVLAECPVTGYASPALALATVLGDWGGFVGACPVLRTAEAASAHQPLYAYEFGEDSGQVTDDGFPMGSYHGLDLPYVWDVNAAWNQYPELTAAQRRLSATVIGYWSAFARTGDPNGFGTPRWPDFGSTGTVLGLSTGGIAPTPYAADHRCDFWADLPR